MKQTELFNRNKKMIYLYCICVKTLNRYNAGWQSMDRSGDYGNTSASRGQRSSNFRARAERLSRPLLPAGPRRRHHRRTVSVADGLHHSGPLSARRRQPGPRHPSPLPRLRRLQPGGLSAVPPDHHAARRAGQPAAGGALDQPDGLRQRRGRQPLLRDINCFANPRFGIDRTVADVMARCRVHFGASVCLLVARRARSRRYELRIAGGGATATPQRLPPDAPLARLECSGTLLFERPRFGWMSCRLLRHDGAGQWGRAASAEAEAIAALCEARSFISAPLAFRGGSARITICAGGKQGRFEPADALFLEQVAAQVLPGIENLYLLDHMASMAALRERRAMAHDLHDSAIQPYIGLNTALAALRLKAAPDNPLCAEIEQLAAMSADVIGDLRRFAGNFNHGGARGDLIDAPLRRQLLRAKQWYDVDIALDVTGAAGMGDRMCAAVLQLSHEGISNICKHTQARHASLRIACDAKLVRLDIENDSAQPVPHFIPRSITARATALGGYAAVEQRRGATLVRIAIPV